MRGIWEENQDEVFTSISYQPSAISNQLFRNGATIRDFRNLQVWEKTHILALDIYKVTTSFPKDEIYGLTSQIRRSSTSIPTNIAEGRGRNGDAELARFLTISMGSASEVEYQLLLAHDLGYLDKIVYSELNEKVTEVKRMLAGSIKTLKK